MNTFNKPNAKNCCRAARKLATWPLRPWKSEHCKPCNCQSASWPESSPLGLTGSHARPLLHDGKGTSGAIATRVLTPHLTGASVFREKADAPGDHTASWQASAGTLEGSFPHTQDVQSGGPSIQAVLKVRNQIGPSYNLRKTVMPASDQSPHVKLHMRQGFLRHDPTRRRFTSPQQYGNTKTVALSTCSYLGGLASKAQTCRCQACGRNATRLQLMKRCDVAASTAR